MANMQKYAASAAGHLAAHYERRQNDKGEYVKFGNQDIDTSKSHLNYNLAPHHEHGQIDFIRQRVAEVRCQKRADVNVMCSWVVTLPKFQYAQPDIYVYPNNDVVERLFFERTYRFLADRYGGKNVISAYVHKDEKTPHIHFSFVPVTEDKKRGDYKVSAKEVLTRQELKTFHSDLEQHLDQYNDWHFEILNEATKDGNKEVAELKIQTAHLEIQKATQKAAKAHQAVEKVKSNIESLERKKDTLQGEIEDLKTTKETLTAAEVESLRGTKNLLGGLKGVTFKEFETLKSTAAKVERMAAAKDRAEERANSADQRAAAAEQKVKSAYDDANKQLAAKKREIEQDRPSLNMQMENVRLLRENTDLKNTVEKQKSFISQLLSIIKEKLPEVFNKLVQWHQTQNQNKQRKKQNREYDLER